MASYSEPGSSKINIYLPKFNANDSDYLKYGFGRVNLMLSNTIGFGWTLYMVKR